MKKFFRLMIPTFLLLLMWAPLALAQESSGAQATAGMTLTPPPTDVSIALLGDIFGIVDGVLHGTGSQIVGQMFSVFNAAILIFAALVLGYLVFAGVLKTAGEGEFLGKNWDSIWIPLRAALGVALLIPKKSGYCLMQILVMWIVVQGVGVADLTWKKTLGYLASGGVIVQQTKPASAQKAESILYSAGSMLSSLVCMHSIENQLTQQQTDAAASGTSVSYGTVPNFSSTVQVVDDPSNAQSGGQMVQFPGQGITSYSDFSSLLGICGTITWEPPPLPSYMSGSISDSDAQSWEMSGSGSSSTISSSQVDPQYASLANALLESKSLAVMQMVLDLDPLAQQIVNNNFAPTDQQVPLGYLQQSKDGDQWVSGNSTQGATLTQGTELSDAANDYLGIMQPAMHALEVNPTQLAFIKGAIEKGWILAGAYYFNLTALNNNTATNFKKAGALNAVSPPQSETVTGSNSVLVTGGFFSDSSTYLKNINTLVFCSSLGMVDSSNLKADTSDGCPVLDQTYLYGAENYKLTYGYEGGAGTAKQLSKLQKSGVGGKASKAIITTLSPMAGVAIAMGQLTHAQQTNANPVASMALLGNSLMEAAVNVSVGGAAAFGVVAATLGAAFGFTFSVAPMTIELFLLPVILAIVAVLFSTGGMLAYYLPLLPFIVFTFSAIGWMIAVIESMVAAPLVAMGIAHPEGQHPVLGKSEPAMFLLLNLFIRPTLMVFGLIAGIILSYVGVWLLNMGFGQAIKSLFVSMTDSLAAIIVFPLAMAIIYTSICYAIINKSFSLIYNIPDKVMRWLSGGMQESFGGEAQQAVGEVKGAVSGGMDTAGKGVAAAGEQGLEQKKKPEGGKTKVTGSKDNNIESST